MKVNRGYGITAVVADAQEAVAGEWAALDGIDLVRVEQPAEHDVAALVAAGFVHKPTRLTWIAATGPDGGDLVDRLTTRQRNNVRIAARRAAAEGLDIVVRQPIGEELFDAFLALYRRRVAEMVNGIDVASKLRPSIVDNSGYLAVLGYAGSRLVGCCVCQECPDEQSLRLRFSAVEPDQRRSSLARVLYLEAVRQAGRGGHRWVTLGNDPNLYGHLCKPGLISFKANLGFRPVPSHAFLSGDGNDEADLVVNLAAFTDPTVMLGYPGDGSTGNVDGVAWPALEAVVLSADPALDLRPYRTDMINDIRLRTVAVTRPSDAGSNSANL